MLNATVQMMLTMALLLYLSGALAPDQKALKLPTSKSAPMDYARSAMAWACQLLSLGAKLSAMYMMYEHCRGVADKLL